MLEKVYIPELDARCDKTSIKLFLYVFIAIMAIHVITITFPVEKIYFITVQTEFWVENNSCVHFFMEYICMRVSFWYLCFICFDALIVFCSLKWYITYCSCWYSRVLGASFLSIESNGIEGRLQVMSQTSHSYVKLTVFLWSRTEMTFNKQVDSRNKTSETPLITKQKNIIDLFV